MGRGIFLDRSPQCTARKAQEHKFDCGARHDLGLEVVAGALDGAEGGGGAEDIHARDGGGGPFAANAGGGAQARFPEALPDIELVEDAAAVALPPFAEFAGVLDAVAGGGDGDGFAAGEEAVAGGHEVRFAGEGKGAAGAATAGGGGLGGEFGGDAAFAKAGFDLGAGDGVDVDAAAAADDGLEHRLGGGGDEGERGVAGGLLEGLEDGVGGIAAEPLGGIEDDHAGAGFEGVAGDEVDDAADLADADIAGVGVAVVGGFAGAGAAERLAGADGDDVRVGAFVDLAAGAADVAGEAGGIGGGQGIAEEGRAGGGRGAFAVQQLGVFEGEQAAPRALRPREQEGVRRIRAGGERAQVAEDGLVADERRHGGIVRRARVGDAAAGLAGVAARGIGQAPAVFEHLLLVFVPDVGPEAGEKGGGGIDVRLAGGDFVLGHAGVGDGDEVIEHGELLGAGHGWYGKKVVPNGQQAGCRLGGEWEDGGRARRRRTPPAPARAGRGGPAAASHRPSAPNRRRIRRMSDTIIETTSGGVRVIRLNRPERMNSLGGTLLGDVVEAFIEGAANDAVRAFVVTGEGRAWCAGADLLDMGGVGVGGGPRNPRATALDDIGAVGRAVLAIYNCNKPTIAAVNGVAVGGGFGLCTAFDVRVASEQARFGTIFIKRALAPDCGLSWFLPRLVGPEAAADLFYTGRIVDAQEALRLGIVSRVVPHEALMDEAVKLANEYARQAPSALTLTRRALQRSAVLTLEQQLEFEWTNQRTRLASPEFQEALSAFREKREPNFS